jgi:hypothetical protein
MRRPGQFSPSFSNSDHLQTAAAIAARCFGLPGKDWRTGGTDPLLHRDRSGHVAKSAAPSQHENDGVCLTYQPLRNVGEAIQLTNSNKDYVGVLRGSGPDTDLLAAAVENTSRTLAWEIAQ